MGGLIIKILVWTLNIVLWLSGILLITFGSIALASPSSIISLLNLISGVQVVTTLISTNDFFMGMSIFMIVLGVFLFFFGGVGCFGAFRMNRNSIRNYWIMLILGVLTEIGAIIYGAVFPPTMYDTIDSELTTSLNTYFLPVNISGTDISYSTNGSAAAWEELQSQTKCCGAKGPKDYNSTSSWKPPVIIGGYTFTFVPPTCCINTVGDGKNVSSVTDFTDLTACAAGTSGYYTIGCDQNVENMIWQFDYIAIIISSCLMAAQILGIILTVHHWHKMER